MLNNKDFLNAVATMPLVAMDLVIVRGGTTGCAFGANSAGFAGVYAAKPVSHAAVL